MAVVDKLHTYFCEESECDFHRMKKILTRDPDALDRLSLVRFYDDGSEHSLTPILIAIDCNHLECVKFLLEYGANKEPQGTRGIDAFSHAITNEHYDIIEFLIDHGITPHHGYLSNLTYYVHGAVCNSSPEMVQFLIDHGALTEDINYIEKTYNMNYLMPTITAIKWERPKTLKTLLLNGAITDPDKYNLNVDDEKHDALLLSLQLIISFDNNLKKKIEIMNILYQFGVNFLKPTRMGPHPLAILESDLLRDEARVYVSLVGPQPTRPDFSSENRQLLAAELRALTSAPMSLKGQCRLVIRQRMGRRFKQDATKLTDLPRELNFFIRFKSDL